MPTTTAHGIVIPAAGTEPADLYGVSTRLGNSVEAVLFTAWIAPTFTNSWVNYGSGEQIAQYRKAGDKVEIRGSIKNGTNGTPAFTLPVGFRPAAIRRFAVDSNGGYGRVIVGSDGTVTPSLGASSAHYSLNISFDLAA